MMNKVEMDSFFFVIWMHTRPEYLIVVLKHPGGLFIEPAFSTFAVFVINFIPQITVVLHLSQSSISLKSTRVLFTGYVKHLSGTIFFSAPSVLHIFCSELGEVFVGTVFPYM